METPTHAHAEQPKWALRSRTIIGAIVGALPAVLRMCGVQFDDAAAQEIGGALTTLGGFAVVVHGRFSATRPITLLPGGGK